MLGCFVWLDFVEGDEFSNKLFLELLADQILDKDVDLQQRRIVREMDREIENETSKENLNLKIDAY